MTMKIMVRKRKKVFFRSLPVLPLSLFTLFLPLLKEEKEEGDGKKKTLLFFPFYLCILKGREDGREEERLKSIIVTMTSSRSSASFLQ